MMFTLMDPAISCVLGLGIGAGEGVTTAARDLTLPRGSMHPRDPGKRSFGVTQFCASTDQNRVPGNFMWQSPKGDPEGNRSEA